MPAHVMARSQLVACTVCTKITSGVEEREKDGGSISRGKFPLASAPAETILASFIVQLLQRPERHSAHSSNFHDSFLGSLCMNVEDGLMALCGEFLWASKGMQFPTRVRSLSQTKALHGLRSAHR